MKLHPEYCQILNEELSKRQSKNSLYSLRSFARDLQISAGALSQIMQGKRPLTLERATGFIHRLKLTVDREKLLLDTVNSEQQQRKSILFKSLKRVKEKFKYRKIESDKFFLIKDWYYLAILNLIKLKSFENSLAWISEQLGIKQSQVKGAISALKQIGLLKETDGKLTRLKNPIETTSDITSKDIQYFQSQVIKRSLKALVDKPVEHRDITSIMFTLDQDKLLEAKKRIQLFRKEMAEFCTSEDADQVYSLSIQLFAQSKGSHNL